MSDKNIRFFLGANTAFGFHSLFDELHTDNKETFILKGGPGTGKSSGMKRLAEELGDNSTEYIYCSSDTSSLDAVIFPPYGVCIADGTAPHLCEPMYPGVREHIVPLGNCWNTSALKNQSDNIISIGKNKSRFYKQGYTFLRCAYTFLQDSMSLALENCDKEKAQKYAENFADKNFKPILEKNGSQKLRYLSSFSCKGYEFFADTVSALCNKITVINDPYCSVADFILQRLRSLAISRGYSVIVCPYTLNPEMIEHILVPEADIAIITQNRLYDCNIDYLKQIHSSRFLDKSTLQSHKTRISFNNKFIFYSLEKAKDLFLQASQYHSKLEEIYIPTVDFKKVDQMFDNVKNSILSDKQ